MPILNRTKQTFCIKGISFCVLNTGVLARHFRHWVWQISFIYVVCASTSILSGDQEYERAVIFRLGRLLSGGARGPGVFFIIPCVDIYEKIDMRTQTFDVPPQEVTCPTPMSISDHQKGTFFKDLFSWRICAVCIQ